jgi:uncharacterized protein HemX
MTIDWQALGGYAAAAGALATGAWAWWLKQQKARAETRADVAEADAARTVADAQQTIYKTLTERLTTLEAEMRAVRAELDSERQHNRRLTLHIWKLEGLMRKAGIEPPPFEDTPVKAGGTD